MSEPKFSSTELKSWLEKETSAILTPVHAQAQKLRDETHAALQSLTDASKMLLDNSAREIERRNLRVYNRARALNKLARLFLDRLRKLNAPEQVSYDGLNRFAQETQKVFLVTEIDIKNWFPRISPFFIIDRRKFLAVYEKTKLTFTALNDFLTKEYVKTKTLEETFQLLSELQALEKQLSDIAAQREKLKNERFPLEAEITELEQKIADLKNKGPIDQLRLLEAEIEALNNEAKNELRHLQKPFIKMQALAFQGGGAGLTQDELSRLNQYLDKPFAALAAEEAGCPMLKQILEKCARLMDSDALKLKPEKARKAEQALGCILRQDSLATLHRRCIEVAERQKQLLASEQLDEIRRSVSAFEEQVGLLKARKLSAETHEAVKEQEYNAVVDRIRNHKSTIEKNIYSSIGKKIQIA
ncbi:MAG: hypothetical protein NWE94_05910 [Candidatus Bathyarchaeota archaeon]|nr:hypothetical protein [Candidatus Bathyarchaeota archaeon]